MLDLFKRPGQEKNRAKCLVFRGWPRLKLRKLRGSLRYITAACERLGTECLNVCVIYRTGFDCERSVWASSDVNGHVIILGVWLVRRGTWEFGTRGFQLRSALSRMWHTLCYLSFITHYLGEKLKTHLFLIIRHWILWMCKCETWLTVNECKADSGLHANKLKATTGQNAHKQVRHYQSRMWDTRATGLSLQNRHGWIFDCPVMLKVSFYPQCSANSFEMSQFI